MPCRSECRLGHFDCRKPPVRSRPILADRVEATNDRYGDSGRLGRGNQASDSISALRARKPASPRGGRFVEASADGVPDDDLLRRVVTGRRGDVAVDGPELGRRERDRDVFLAGALRDTVPAGAQLEAVLAGDDEVVGRGVLGLTGVGLKRDRGGDVEGGEGALILALGQPSSVLRGRSF